MKKNDWDVLSVLKAVLSALLWTAALGALVGCSASVPRITFPQKDQRIAEYRPLFFYELPESALQGPVVRAQLSSDESFSTLAQELDFAGTRPGSFRLDRPIKEGRWFLRVGTPSGADASRTDWSPAVAFWIDTPRFLVWPTAEGVIPISFEAEEEDLIPYPANENDKADDFFPVHYFRRLGDDTWMSAVRYRSWREDDSGTPITKVFHSAKNLKFAQEFPIAKLHLNSFAAADDGTTAVGGYAESYEGGQLLLYVQTGAGQPLFQKTSDGLAALHYSGAEQGFLVPPPPEAPDATKIEPQFSHRVTALLFTSENDLLVAGYTQFQYLVFHGNSGRGKITGFGSWVLCFGKDGHLKWKTAVPDGRSAIVLACIATPDGFLAAGALYPGWDPSEGLPAFTAWRISSDGKTVEQALQAPEYVGALASNALMSSLGDGFALAMGNLLVKLDGRGDFRSAATIYGTSDSLGYKDLDFLPGTIQSAGQDRLLVTGRQYEGDRFIAELAFVTEDSLSSIVWQKKRAPGHEQAEGQSGFWTGLVLKDAALSIDEVNEVKQGNRIAAQDLIGGWRADVSAEGATYWFYSEGSYSLYAQDYGEDGRWYFDPESGSLTLLYPSEPSQDDPEGFTPAESPEEYAAGPAYNDNEVRRIFHVDETGRGYIVLDGMRFVSAEK